MKSKKHDFVSFDGGVRCSGKILKPEDESEFSADDWQHELKLGERGVIPRGAGMSFVAASCGDGVTSLDMTGLHRIDVLHPQNSKITVDAGTSVGALLSYLLDNGFYIPILPGYPTITVGGCIAADVHGKNQLRDGNFIGQVEKFRLHHIDHGIIEVSEDSNRELFDLTLGGFGLTGTVLSTTLRVKKTSSRMIDVSVESVDDINALPAMLEKRANESDYVVSWHDFNQLGSRFGQGFLEFGTFVDQGGAEENETRQAVFPIKTEKKRTSPLTLSPQKRGANMPPLFGQVTSTVMNSVFAFKQRLQCGKAQCMPIETCYFPNKLLRDLYFHSFGKRGLHEHQVIVPAENFPDYVARIRAWLEKNDLPICIASSKMFRGEQVLLRFSGSGVCFALDFPRCAAGSRFLQHLDQLTVDLGCIPNIFKDSRLSRGIVESCYPGYSEFKTRLRAFDPNRRYQSELSRRLDL